MKNTGRLRIEKETIINFNEQESQASVWSASESMEKKMIALGLVGESTCGGMKWQIPKGWVKIIKPRNLTEAQREALKERGKALSLRPRPVAIKDKTT